jgi:putative ABC transport system substrate-binding protein
MARPGGNVTGFTPFEFGIGGKWLELLREVAPNVTRAGIVRDPAISAGLGQCYSGGGSRRCVWK